MAVASKFLPQMTTARQWEILTRNACFEKWIQSNRKTKAGGKSVIQQVCSISKVLGSVSNVMCQRRRRSKMKVRQRRKRRTKWGRGGGGWGEEGDEEEEEKWEEEEAFMETQTMLEELIGSDNCLTVIGHLSANLSRCRSSCFSILRDNRQVSFSSWLLSYTSHQRAT